MYIVRLICLSNSYRNSSSLAIPWADEISRMLICLECSVAYFRDVAVRGGCLLAVIGPFFNYSPLKTCSNQKKNLCDENFIIKEFSESISGS